MTEGKPNFGEYHRQGMACLNLGQFVRRARHTSSLAYDFADVVRARAES
jgi:hypothetical protein